MAFDLTALSDYTTEHAGTFFAKSVMKSKLAALATVYTGFKPGTHKLPDVEHDYDLLQNGEACGFNASGDLNIEQRQIIVESLKINTQYCVRDLEKKFTRQIMPSGQDYEGLAPLEAELMASLDRAIGKMMEQVLVKGDKSTAPNALSSLDYLNGLNKVIATEIAGGGIPAAQALSSGALTTANIVSRVEALYDALPVDAYSTINDEKWYVLMGDDKAKMYDRGYRDNLGTTVYNTGFEKRFVDGTNIGIEGIPGLNGTDKLVLIKESDLVLAVDVEGEEMDLKVGMDQYEENVWIKGRFAAGFQIHFPSQVVVDNY
jgi:hypothetical protein